MADNDVTVTFGAKIDQLQTAVSQVKAELGTLDGAVSKVGGQFGKLTDISGIFAGALATLGLEKFTRGMAESGVEAEKLSLSLGITYSQMLDLKAAAALGGVSVEALTTSLERMSLQVQRSTRDAFSPQAQALKVLGLNAKDLIGLRADEYFTKITEAASKFAPSLNLTNALMAIGGRSMAQMVSVFVRGSEELKLFEERMAAVKGGTSGFVEAATGTHRELLIMDGAVSTLNKRIFLELKPTLDIIIQLTAKWTASIKDSIVEGGVWGVILNTVIAGLKAIVYNISGAAAAIEIIRVKAQGAWNALKADGEEAVAKVAKETEEKLKKIEEDWLQLKADLYGGPIYGPARPGPTDNAAALDELARKRLEVQMKEIDTQIKLTEMGLERSKTLYDRDVLNLAITEAQKIQEVARATDERYADEVSLLQRKLRLGGLDIVQKKEIEDKITEAQVKALGERLKLQNDYAKQVQGEWKSILDSVQRAWDSQLRGLLEGTTNWKDAMRNIFKDLVLNIISEFEKLAVVKPLIAALSTAFSPETLMADAFKIVKKLLGEVFTGATAFFAPTLGPAAPAAGAAVTAATEAAAATYGFEKGAWSVPETANALVHKGEMILPADIASSMRQVLSGGGGGRSVSLSIQAWDGNSVARWLSAGGAEQLSRAVAGQWTENPGQRPRY